VGKSVRLRTLIVDSGLAAALAGLSVATTVGPWTWQGAEYRVDGWGLILMVGAAVPLAARRIWPLAALLTSAGTTSAYLALRYPYSMILLSLAVAMYSAAAQLPLRRALSGSAVALAGLLVHALSTTDGVGAMTGLAAAAWAVVPFAIGRVVRISRDSAMRARADETRRRADEERLRIVREVHDVVGHGLAAINMQAEIALHVLAKRPEQLQAALMTISRTSKMALEDLRMTLEVVRREQDGAAPRTPEPGLANLDDLVARMADSGVTVHVALVGDRVAAPAAVDLAAYRIVQEALTNVLRHTDRAPADVTIRYRPEEMIIEVTDNGRGTKPRLSSTTSGSGHGIPGMAARVSALGGGFEAGPQPEGGFRILARLPLRGVQQ
jgi:signal transduction histidine kinase